MTSKSEKWFAFAIGCVLGCLMFERCQVQASTDDSARVVRALERIASAAERCSR